MTQAPRLTRTVAIDIEIANNVNEEAVAQTRDKGRKVHVREIVENALNMYIEQEKTARAQRPRAKAGDPAKGA